MLSIYNVVVTSEKKKQKNVLNRMFKYCFKWTFMTTLLNSSQIVYLKHV